MAAFRPDRLRRPARAAAALALALALQAGCGRAPAETPAAAAAGEPRRVAFPASWPGDPGFGAEIDNPRIPEPSGIVWHPSRKTLFAVSDNGGLFEMNRDGRILATHDVPGDLEGITVDPASGILYIAVEGEDVVLEAEPDGGRVLRRFPIDRAFAGDPEFLKKETHHYDNGIESIAFVPDAKNPEGGTFYAGNQDDPPCIVELSVPLRSAPGGGPARILRVLPFKPQDPSALFFDPATRHLWQVSDADNTISELTLDGRLVAEYAFPGNDQEGLAFDDRGFLYIAQDSGGILKLQDLRTPKVTAR